MDLNFEDLAPERGDWCRKAAWIADRVFKCGYVVMKLPGFQADIRSVTPCLRSQVSLQVLMRWKARGRNADRAGLNLKRCGAQRRQGTSATAAGLPRILATAAVCLRRGETRLAKPCQNTRRRRSRCLTWATGLARCGNASDSSHEYARARRGATRT